jgi:hypothetical protein
MAKMRLQELLGCLWHNIAELAGIVRDDRHHRINHLIWIESGFLMSYACIKKISLSAVGWLLGARYETEEAE